MVARGRHVRVFEQWYTTAISIMVAGLDPGVGSATWYVFDKGVATMFTVKVSQKNSQRV